MDDTDEDKTYAAMGMAKTIGTVSVSFFFLPWTTGWLELCSTLLVLSWIQWTQFTLDSAARFVYRLLAADPSAGTRSYHSDHHLHVGEQVAGCVNQL